MGFERCGIAPARPIERIADVRRWLDRGRAGSMDYMHRYVEQRTDPTALLPGARSVFVVALVYHHPVSSEMGGSENDQDSDGDATGRVAMYAWGRDYHKIVKKKLFQVVDRLRQAVDEPFESKVCVDTAPIIEREFAAAAGVGWIGKNTLVMDAALGSYFFLGVVVTTLDLEPDEPQTDHCGTCTACLDACPTTAFPAAYEMDASRCISYLTIEHRGDIDISLQEKMDDWVFGCDVCQEVCPHNRRAPRTTEPAFAVREPGSRLALADLISWTEGDYRKRLQGSAMKRATLPMLQRNARIAGNNARLEGPNTERMP